MNRTNETPTARARFFGPATALPVAFAVATAILPLGGCRSNDDFRGARAPSHWAGPPGVGPYPGGPYPGGPYPDRRGDRASRDARRANHAPSYPAGSGREVTNRSGGAVSYWDGDRLSGTPSIKIDLGEQRAYFYKGDQLAGVSSVSTGREGYNTPAGTFRITDKNADHRSNLYGDYVDDNGRVVASNVDVRKDKAPPGTRFRGAPMPNFMRFNGAIGMHGGYLPGYPASHGCVRLPEDLARRFYANVSPGTEVTVVH
ncbi:MAG: L,D-transpeptidase [Verrucomicrobiales bacterium]